MKTKENAIVSFVYFTHLFCYGKTAVNAKRKLQAKGEITCMTAISPHVLTGEELRRVRLHSRAKGETFTLQTGKDTRRVQQNLSVTPI